MSSKRKISGRKITKIELEMAQYPKTGIINPFTETKFVLTKEMVDFFNSFLLQYKDYPDSKIANEFSKEFHILAEAAKVIEHKYVAVNRARINKRIQKYMQEGYPIDEIIKFLGTDFGLDEVNAQKYIQRCGMDRVDIRGGLFVREYIQSKSHGKQRNLANLVNEEIEFREEDEMIVAKDVTSGIAVEGNDIEDAMFNLEETLELLCDEVDINPEEHDNILEGENGNGTSLYGND